MHSPARFCPEQPSLVGSGGRLFTVSFPLFELFPKLSQAVPHVALGAFPTPVESLQALSRELGAGDSDAWI